MVRESEEKNNLGKLAAECADKLRGVERVIPPPLPPVINVTLVDKHPTIPWWEEAVVFAAVLSISIGFVALGFAIAGSVQ